MTTALFMVKWHNMKMSSDLQYIWCSDGASNNVHTLLHSCSMKSYWYIYIFYNEHFKGGGKKIGHVFI